MFRLLKSLFGQPAPVPTSSWIDLPDDTTDGNKPYDPGKRLRIATTEIDDDGRQFTLTHDLQFVKQTMSLYMMFANGCFEEMRAECESSEAYELLITLAQNIGAFVPCDGSDKDFAKRSLFREGCDAYCGAVVDDVYMFVNPVPRPSAFSDIEEVNDA